MTTVGEPATTVARQISFKLIGLPGSMNELFEMPQWGSGLPRRRLKAEWALWKSRAKPFIPRCDWPSDCYFRVEMLFESPNWFYKNGKLRRRDVVNLEKLILDTIFEKLDRDDSRVVEKVSRKLVGRDDQVHITLTAVEWK